MSAWLARWTICPKCVIASRKARSLCRLVAAPEMGHDLVKLAIVATAAQLDKIASGYRRAHHRRVHHGGWTLSGDANGQLAITSPDGRQVTESEAADEARNRQCTPRQIVQQHRRRGLEIDHASISAAHNERLQFAWTVNNICDLETTRGVWT